MISTGVIWICFFVFNFLFDIRERPENAIKTSESGWVCKYATPESEQMKAKGYRTSISPAKKTMDVRPWLCGRTFKGCLHVRREGLRTYVQRVPGRTSKEPLNRAERNWTICFMKYCTKDALLCSIWATSFFQIVWDGRHFSNVKMSFCLRVRVTQNVRKSRIVNGHAPFSPGGYASIFHPSADGIMA